MGGERARCPRSQQSPAPHVRCNIRKVTLNALQATDIYWLAGLVEGEGWIGLRKSQKDGGSVYLYPQLTIRMTDRDVLERAHALFGGHVYGPYKLKNPNCKDVYHWGVSRQSAAVGILLTLYSLMGSRRQAQIRSVLDSWRNANQE